MSYPQHDAARNADNISRGIQSAGPWQIDWKNPTWKRYSKHPNSTSPTDGAKVVGVASAQVLPSEIAEGSPILWRNLEASFTNRKSSVPGHEDQWLVTVTLLDPTGKSQDPPVATEVLVELLHCETQQVAVSRRLVWPETMESATRRHRKNKNFLDDMGDLLFPWKTKDNETSLLDPTVTSDTGLVSATLCRQPLGGEAKQVEALDLISSMAVGLGPQVVSSDRVFAETPSEPVSRFPSMDDGDSLREGNTSGTDSRPIDPLYLAGVTSKGMLCIYSIWNLISNEPSEGADRNSDDDKTMATWLLGTDIFQQLESIWLPLSVPDATVSLSILDHSNHRHLEHIDEDEDIIAMESSAEGIAEPRKHPKSTELWSPWIEQSTLANRTVSNRPTAIYTIGPSSPYLVILGSGVRPSRSSSLSRTTPTKNQSSDTSESKRDDRGKDSAARHDKFSPTKGVDNQSEWWTDPVYTAVSFEGEEEKETSSSEQPKTEWWTSHDAGRGDNDEACIGANIGVERGGFITFCSLASWVESKTLFLDFVPRHVSHIERWHDMELLVCVGDTRTCAIRLDTSPTNVIVGLDDELNNAADAEDGGDKASNYGAQSSSQRAMVPIHRYQIINVDVNLPPASIKTNIGHRILSVSSSIIPTLLQIYTEFDTNSQQERGLLINSIFSGISGQGSIVTSTQEDGHVAQIPILDDQTNNNNNVNRSLLQSSWGYLGEGWSLFGASNRVFFLCWEGATASRGVTLLQELPMSPANVQSFCHIAQVLPLPNRTKNSHRQSKHSSTMELLSTNSFDASADSKTQERLEEGFSSELLAEALQRISDRRELSISSLENASTSLMEGTVSLNPHQKSERLLHKLTSWTQLEETEANRERLESQLPIIVVREGGSNGEFPIRTLYMRQVVIENGHASPFPQVLGWMSQRHDYFTAASIALDLLHDAETLFHLWKNAEKIDEEDEQTKLKGLLDGIIPVKILESDGQTPRSSTLTQLADMTVGCLTKGGLGMHKTLIKFLQTNTSYDAARASLMLVATLVKSVSADCDAIASAMGSHATDKIREFSIEERLWPLECLMAIARARGYLKLVLDLLNAAIPDEMRHRQRQAGSGRVPEMDLTKKIISKLISCEDQGTSLLLGLFTEPTLCTFWASLDDETKQQLALIRNGQKHPMLFENEVREWVRGMLHEEVMAICGEECIRFDNDCLREIVVACLLNAGCDLDDFVLDPKNTSMMSFGSGNSAAWADLEMDGEDGLFQHKLEILETRNALDPTPGSGGLDFDLIISCLLLLKTRSVSWRECSPNAVSTQLLLDSVCYLAGRPNSKSEIPRFYLDSQSLMRQCASSGNVRAGANLVGGNNGFILSCCDILMLELQISMEDAESFIVQDSLATHLVLTKEALKFQLEDFGVSDSHRQLLWLLDDHVLGMNTYGDFDPDQRRKGTVDPVFAARSIFRTWLCLTYSCKDEGTLWISQWLSRRLGLEGGDARTKHRHRLACAALVRALLWPQNEGDLDETDVASCSMLGHILDFDRHFLIQLAQCSCGLVESVPPSVAESIVGFGDAGSELSRTLSPARRVRSG